MSVDAPRSVVLVQILMRAYRQIALSPRPLPLHFSDEFQFFTPPPPPPKRRVISLEADPDEA